jgi:hypothetical protein
VKYSAAKYCAAASCAGLDVLLEAPEADIIVSNRTRRLQYLAAAVEDDFTRRNALQRRRKSLH